MQATFRERAISALGTAIIVALLGYALLLGLTVDLRTRGEQAIALLALAPTPPPPPPPKPHVERPRLSRKSGKASPPNLRNKATAIIAPPPAILLPAPSPVVTAPRPGVGMAPSSGASDRRGPGEGAGGQGNGTGSGGSGDGEGDGGDIAPRQIKGRLKGDDIPPDLVHGGFRGTVSVRYGVDITGHIDECTVTRSSGSTELDQLTCQLIQKRFRFEPSRDSDGRPVHSWIEENHSFDVDKEEDPGAKS